ncbi:MAG: DNA alkylation repair protein [Planctomycetes bacterium]|nr:DNA alkylation repair protein [Planctomycetota bacterium]
MPAKTKAPRAAKTRMSLAEAMSALEKAGSAQTRKTYARHGATEPLFGVSFATLKELTKRIDVDHELALALWDTGNFDARNLAVKIVDPARISSQDLDRWAQDMRMRMCVGYVGALAAESPHASAKARLWLSKPGGAERCTGWSLVGTLAMRDESTPDAWFAERLAEIERTMHSAPNEERGAMNQALIAIGCRSAALRKAAVAASKRIGKVEVDHGDTACKTPDAAEYIAKTWAHSTSKGFVSPAAHERTRESMRRRC